MVWYGILGVSAFKHQGTVRCSLLSRSGFALILQSPGLAQPVRVPTASSQRAYALAREKYRKECIHRISDLKVLDLIFFIFVTWFHSLANEGRVFSLFKSKNKGVFKRLPCHPAVAQCVT